MRSLKSPSRESSYEKSYKKHGHSPRSLKWAHYRAAATRYRELVRHTRLDGMTILDAGCGMGDLLPYIYARTDSFDYLGIDITPAFIEIAKERYLGHEFRVGDPFDGSMPAESFDVVLCSGVMNSNVPDWQKQRKEMIAALYRLCRNTLAFNMAGGINPPENNPDAKIAYASAEDIANSCRTLTPKVSVQTDYHPKDFTVVMRK
jgi:2-polyprenyl-3-methyl-5-hydroxy-6-metoxy-1,4-benzoquinol methylase